MLVSNLYPFEETVAKGAADAETIEQIDIGGPAMVRAASKNHGSVAVVTSPAQYAAVRMALSDGGFTLEERKRLAAAAFARTAAYDAAVASWFAASYAPDATAVEAGWPAFTGMAWSRAKVLRYGENPHQRAALYLPSRNDRCRRYPGRWHSLRRGSPWQAHVVQQLRRRRRRPAGRV